MAGFLPCTDETLRPTPWELLPQLPSKGPFRFPEPWNTIATRVTDDAQGALLEPVGYSYWRNMNAHRNNDFIYVMLAFRNKGPCLFVVSKIDGTSKMVDFMEFSHTGEGLYFSAHKVDILYVNLGSTFYRYNVETGSMKEIFSIDKNCYLWQCHSNFDETIHSATFRDKNTYEMLGAVVYNENLNQLRYFPKKGDFDECQIDKSGKFLVIKETYLGRGECNRVVHLETEREIIISNDEGAIGHSDSGDGFIIGEVDVNPLPNCVEMRDLNRLSRSIQYHGTKWSTGVGHVSHTNVHNPSFIVISNASRDIEVPRQNEIIQVPLDGSQTFRPLAPSCTDLDYSGGDVPGNTKSDNDYRKMPKGNLDAYGEYYIWTANHRSDHLDAFIMRLD